jgi:hypothetical protein
MTAALPEIIPSISDDGTTAIVVVGDREFTAMADLVAAFPALRDDAAQMALAVNGLAQKLAFDVILDPAGYETAARERIAAEDPDAPFRQGTYRLRDFGMPQFGVIHPPAIKGDRLVFYAVQSLTGLPYRVEAGRDGDGPAYAPAPLDPLAAAPEMPSDGDDAVITQDGPGDTNPGLPPS